MLSGLCGKWGPHLLDEADRPMESWEEINRKTCLRTLPIGGSKGGVRDACLLPLRHPISFNFMQFSGQFGKMVCWCPLPPESWRPHLGEILDPPLLPERNVYKIT